MKDTEKGVEHSRGGDRQPKAGGVVKWGENANSGGQK